jgi:cystathionine beta-lyase family protein involved in aluminum resistance
MKTLLILLITISPALAYNDGGSYEAVKEVTLTPVGSQYKVVKEPVVVVDRKVLGKDDYLNDTSILIANPKITVSEIKPIKENIIEYVNKDYQEPVEDKPVIVTATIESDTEAPVNYPL